MAKLLPLTLDELLTTTRSVRKWLDLERPVDHETITECLQIAIQAPAASNMQHWSFVVVTDPAKRAALAAIYKRAWDIYLTLPVAAPNLSFPNAVHQAMQIRVTASAQYLADHLQEVPVFVIHCFLGRIEAELLVMQSASWGTICPAAWVELHARCPRPRSRKCLDLSASVVRGGSCTSAGYSLRRCYAGLSNPRRSYQKSRFQAGLARTAGQRSPLERVVRSPASPPGPDSSFADLAAKGSFPPS
jgi:nitroreductase